MEDSCKRIVVNATPLLSNFTGVGQVALEVSRRMASLPNRQVDFFTPFKTFSSIEPILNGDYRLRLSKMAKRIARRLPFKDKIRSFCSGSRGAADSYDLYWEPNYIPLDSIAAKCVVTTVYDMSVFDHPEWHPADRIAWFEQNFFKNIGRSDMVTTISEFSKQRFLAAQQEIREDRIKVIPCGINPDIFHILDRDAVAAFRKRHRLPEQFILFVGTMEPRKNLIHLLSAYAKLSAAVRNDCPLVLVGDVGWQNKKILQRIGCLGSSVRRIGYLRRQEDLALMYNAASVFVFPSLYEGFGIPPLEAMACGTPVCLSSIPVFHEIYGDDAACYADPFDSDSLAAALLRSLNDTGYRASLVQQGRDLSRKYTWDAASEGYASIFKQICP